MVPMTFSLCLAPKDTYFTMVLKGEETAKTPLPKMFHQSLVAGVYVGFGGLCSMAIGGQLPGADPGTQQFVIAALFPITLVLILLTGGSLFTANLATMPAAVFEGKVRWTHAAVSLVVSWLGNFIAAAILALITEYAELCPTDPVKGTGCGMLAAQLVETNVSKTFGQMFVQAVLCNWMVCMAVWLSTQATDMCGKVVGIWFPIAAFMMMGMQHSVTNMFLLPLGLLSGTHIHTFDTTLSDALLLNMLPVSLGNLFAGVICMGASYSYAFGKLGNTMCGVSDGCSCITVGCAADYSLPESSGV